jgi:hypothetical protein
VIVRRRLRQVHCGIRANQQWIREERVLPGNRALAEDPGKRHERSGRRLPRILHQLRRRVERAVAGDELIAPVCQDRWIDALEVLDRERAVVEVAAHRRAVADRGHPAGAECALDEEIPLPRLPVLEVAVEAGLPDAVDLRGLRIAADSG